MLDSPKADDGDDDNDDAKLDVSVHSLIQPPPPGVDEIDNSFDPHQESIWEMLELPLAATVTQESPIVPPATVDSTMPTANLTSADLLISSIRANLSKNSSMTESSTLVPVQNVTPQPPVPPVSPPTSVLSLTIAATKKAEKTRHNDESKEYMNVGSPYKFEHAFQPPSSPPDFYPDMATDLSFACQDDRIDFHDDISDSDQDRTNSQDGDAELAIAENETEERERTSPKQQVSFRL